MKISSIRSFRRVLRRFERLNQSMTSSCCRGVTMAQCHVLLEIEEAAETTIVRLARNLRLDKSTLSRTVEGLVKLGLVKRKPHPTDRRFMLLKLTVSGTKICDEINREADETYLRAFQRIPQEKRDEVRGAFEVIVEAMLEGRPTSKDDQACCS